MTLAVFVSVSVFILLVLSAWCVNLISYIKLKDKKTEEIGFQEREQRSKEISFQKYPTILLIHFHCP